MSRQSVQIWGTTAEGTHHTVKINDTGGLVLVYNNVQTSQTLMDTVSIAAGASTNSTAFNLGTSFAASGSLSTYWTVEGGVALTVDLQSSYNGTDYFPYNGGTSITAASQYLSFNIPSQYCRWNVVNNDGMNGCSVSLVGSYFTSN